MEDFPAFEIDKKSGVPIWVQLYQRFVYLIATGFYKPGGQLPTVRKLAVDLDINYHTVNRVYHELENDGLIDMQSGKGTHVIESVGQKAILLSSKNDQIISELTDNLLFAGMTPEEIVHAVAKHLKVSLNAAYPLSAADETLQERENAG